MIMTEQGETGDIITILLVEDDAPTCWRLQDALVKAGYEVRSAGTLGEARSALAAGAPRVLLTDLRLPDGHGIELIREMRQRFRHRDHGDLGPRRRGKRDLRDHGRRHRLSAQGRLPHRHRHHRARSGRRPFADLGLDRALHRAQNTGRRAELGGAAARPRAQYGQLTPREIDILWGIAKGFSYAEIASHLGLSKQTVPGHIKNIYRKLEVHTRSEAVFEAVQQGLIKL